MKFACGRCWDYDCNCTEAELLEYKIKTQLDGVHRRLAEMEEIISKYKEHLKSTNCYAETKSLKQFLELLDKE